MPDAPRTPGRLLAVSDLHVTHPANRRYVADLQPWSPHDWLLVAGDVGETVEDIEWAVRTLSARFGAVVWTPGNHELWTHRTDPVQLRGEARYHQIVEICRRLGVWTPEDPYPIWTGAGGPATIAPLFLLYDYTFRPPGSRTREEALARARTAGVVPADELLLHPDPYPSRQAWCAARIAHTERLLAARDPELPTILVNHFPLRREPVQALVHPETAPWCGTIRTADWHLRYNATAVVYGHLHIPRTSWYDGVRFEEVSVGYPEEWQRFRRGPGEPRQILPA